MILNPFIPTVLRGNQSTGAVNNYNVGTLLPITTIEWNGAADITIAGIVGGRIGYIFNFKNTSAFVARFLNNSGLTNAGNQLTNIVQSGETPVAFGGYISYCYDGQNWQLIGHDQGAWITVPFAAGNFTASGAMTWTVAGINVTDQSFKVFGNTLIYSINVSGTTTGGVADVELRVALPSTYTGFSTTSLPCQVLSPGLASVLSVGGPVAGLGYERFFSNLNGAVWGLGNTCIVRSSIEFALN